MALWCSEEQEAYLIAYVRGSNRCGKSGGLAFKRLKYPHYTSEWGCLIMRKSNQSFIPANDYSEFHFIIIVRWNEWPVGIALFWEVYWGYFRRLVFGNS